MVFLICGSPPRMRGKRRRYDSTGGKRRITPAHAGKTLRDAAATGAGADHPRACGENIIVFGCNDRPTGSPPRMRGKRFLASLSMSYLRITPAHAGKTSADTGCATRAADHPRACGENYSVSIFCCFCSGSPPRMRGKPGLALQLCIARRITPAHAGKTSLTHISPQVPLDHPRACGENSADNILP